MIIEEDKCLRLQCEVSTKDNWVIISTFLIGWIIAEEKEREIQTSVCSVYWKDTKGEDPTLYHSVCWTNDNNYPFIC